MSPNPFTPAPLQFPTLPEQFERYLILRGWCGQDPAPVVLWLDNPEACKRFHVRAEDGKVWSWGKWHTYRIKAGGRLSVRCPSTLETEEKGLVRTDYPAGAWESELRAVLSEMRKTTATKFNAAKHRTTDDESSTSSEGSYR